MIYNGLPSGETGSETCGTTDSTTSQQGNASLATLSGSTKAYRFNSTDYIDPDYRTSDIIILIETNNNSWYNTWTNNNNYDNLLETTDFCIDMEVDVNLTNDWGYDAVYAPTDRYEDEDGGPTLNCTYENTMKSKVGFLTMDEVWYAGAIKYYYPNYSYYLINVESWWLLSPRGVSPDGALVWYLDGGAASLRCAYVDDVDNTGGVRPVVSLK